MALLGGGERKRFNRRFELDQALSTVEAEDAGRAREDFAALDDVEA